MNNPEFIISIKTSYLFGEKGVEGEIENTESKKKRCLYSPDYSELFKGIKDIFDPVTKEHAAVKR
jgi:hypothetical protein